MQMTQTGELEARFVTEEVSARLPALVHPEWRDRFPWLVQGTTVRDVGGEAFDLALYRDGEWTSEGVPGWDTLRDAAGMTASVHGHQVHEATVRLAPPEASGMCTVDPCDGHVTCRPNVLLGIAAADCVPIFAVDPGSRCVGVFHAGWRGAAAGVLERGVEVLRELGAATERLELHLGPSICGDCYEVGPDVFAALELEAPDQPTPIDLRGALVERAVRVGVEADRVTRSTHCTRCTGSPFYSHRGGDRGRHVGFIATEEKR